MPFSVFTGRAALCFAKDMRKMGGGDESHQLADLGNAQVCSYKQIFCFFATNLVMIAQRRHTCMTLKCAQQIASVDKQCLRHLVQGKLISAVNFYIGLSGLRQDLSAVLLFFQAKRFLSE